MLAGQYQPFFEEVATRDRFEPATESARRLRKGPLWSAGALLPLS